MSTIETLNNLKESGQLDNLIRLGILSKRVTHWMELCLAYEAKAEATGSVMQAMEEVADEFNVSVSLVEKVRRRLLTKA